MAGVAAVHRQEVTERLRVSTLPRSERVGWTLSA